jgi:hypothetical protein
MGVLETIEVRGPDAWCTPFVFNAIIGYTFDVKRNK